MIKIEVPTKIDKIAKTKRARDSKTSYSHGFSSVQYRMRRDTCKGYVEATDGMIAAIVQTSIHADSENENREGRFPAEIMPKKRETERYKRRVNIYPYPSTNEIWNSEGDHIPIPDPESLRPLPRIARILPSKTEMETDYAIANVSQRQLVTLIEALTRCATKSVLPENEPTLTICVPVRENNTQPVILLSQETNDTCIDDDGNLVEDITGIGVIAQARFDKMEKEVKEKYCEFVSEYKETVPEEAVPE